MLNVEYYSCQGANMSGEQRLCHRLTGIEVFSHSFPSESRLSPTQNRPVVIISLYPRLFHDILDFLAITKLF
jgi:hypothetical protein